jgi:hypothetical protein
MLWMYVVSVETMTIMRALTRILDVSEALLGLSLSSWITVRAWMGVCVCVLFLLLLLLSLTSLSC